MSTHNICFHGEIKKNVYNQFLSKAIEVFTVPIGLILTMLWANSADDKLMIFFLFYLANRV